MLGRGRFAARSGLVFALGLVAAGVLVGQTQARSSSMPVVLGYDLSGTFLLDGQPSFPIALSNPPPLGATTPAGGDALDEVVRAGVTLFRVGPFSVPWTSDAIAQTKAWDQAALTRGVRTWISLSNLSTAVPGSRADIMLGKVVGALTSDPSAGGIGMWKGADEPGWGGPPPARLRFAYCRVTSRGDPNWCAGEPSLDPNHPWVTIQAPRGTAQHLSPYSGVTDTHGVDVYPVTATAANPDLHQVGTWTKMLASITPDHSVWATLQICSSGSYDRAGDYVLPTRRQERYMIYDAIVNGARGLSFFGGDNPHCWDLADKTTGWNWTFWNSTLSSLIGEISARSPLAPALTNPGSTRAVATDDPATEAIRRATRTGARWLIAAHDGSGTRQVTISGLPGTITGATVYTEHRVLKVENGSFTDRFQPWQVHVYHLSSARSAA